MTQTATAIATAEGATGTRAGTWAVHSAAALWIAAMFAIAHWSPTTYIALLQEDYFVEWLTVGLFAAAGALRLRYAWPTRRIFELLVAAFCIFVAGEEFSWGQRLFGFTPPDVFLEHNTQQEFTLHNFADVFGKPKGVLIAALAGYGLAVPLLARFPAGRRLGMQSPPGAVIPWLLVAAALLLWYPLEFTGEWVEALAGGLFLVSARPSRTAFASSFAAAIVGATILTIVSARGLSANPAATACARREADALLVDVSGGAATEKLRNKRGSIHKRLWSAIEEGYIEHDALVRFKAVGCGDSQRYAVDPWGMAYWIRVEGAAETSRRVSLYSMGPNRRRDAQAHRTGGDDVVALDILK